MDSETARALLAGGLLGLLIGEFLSPGGQVAVLIAWLALAAVYEAHRATTNLTHTNS